MQYLQKTACFGTIIGLLILLPYLLYGHSVSAQDIYGPFPQEQLSPSTITEPTPTPEPKELIQQAKQQEPEGFWRGMQSAASQVVTLNNPVQLTEPKAGFVAGDEPSFTLNIPQKKQEDVGKTTKNVWQTGEEYIVSVVTDTETGKTYPVTLHKNNAGTFTILPEKDKDWEPGRYTLEIAAKETDFYTRNLTQDFSWGVLALNTKKSIYLPGETVELSFGILDEMGHTLCDAPLSLEIRSPRGTKTVLSRDNGGIRQSGECSGNSVTSLPDYLAEYEVDGTGLYQLTLTGVNANGTHIIQDVFEVRDTVPFDIERTTFPTRVYPVSAYDVELTITAQEDYQGPIADQVPTSFHINNISDNGTVVNEEIQEATNAAQLRQQDEEAYHHIANQSKLLYDITASSSSQLDKTPKKIEWNVDWKAGETHTLSYQIHFPGLSPEYYLIGPFTIGSFQEMRQWQVALDAVITWDGGGSGNGWNEDLNWSSNTEPGTSDLAYFDGTSTKDALIDKDIDVDGISIQTGYTGTITQGAGYTMRIRDQDYTQTTATFVGGDSEIAFHDGNSAFVLSGGTFTATSGQIYTEDDFTVSGGTFNHNNGSFAFTGNQTFTGNITFYNLRSFGCNNTHAIASGSVVTVENFAIFNGSCGNDGWQGPGKLHLHGDLYLFGDGAIDKGNSFELVVNGTGDQTITGQASYGSGQIPGLTINKPSGTLFITDNLLVKDDWIYTTGTIDSTGGTVVFDTDMDITGSHTLTNIGFGDGCSNDITVTAGTILTVTGTTTFGGPGGGCNNDRLYGPGEIHAQGDVITQQNGYDSDAIVVLTGTGDQALIGEADMDTKLPGVTINKPSGTVSVTETVVVTDNWTYISGDIDSSAGTIIFDADLTISGKHRLPNVGFGSGCNNDVTLAADTEASVAGTLTIGAQGTSCDNDRFYGPGELHAEGNIIAQNYGYAGVQVLRITGSGAQSLTGEADTNTNLPGFIIDKPSGTLTISSAIMLQDDIQYIRGTIDPTTSTMVFDGDISIDGSFSLYDGVFNQGCNNESDITAGTTITFLNDVRFGTFSNCGGQQLDGPGTIAIQGDLIRDNNGMAGNANISFTGSNNQNITGWNSGNLPSGTVTIDKTGGEAVLQNAFLVDAGNQDFTVEQGTFNLNDQNLTVDDTFTIGANGNVKLSNDETISYGTLDFNENGSAEYTGTGTYSSLQLGNSYGNLTISGTGSYTPNGAVTINGNFTLSAGTWNAPSSMNIAGNFDAAGGTFVPGSNTVTIVNAAKTTTFLGSPTFYNLTAVTAGKTIVFPAGNTTTVTNTLVMRGASENPITIRSSSPGTQWDFNVPSGTEVTSIHVTDSNACVGSEISALNSGGGGNNSCWVFSANNWYDSAWAARKQITIDHSKVAGDLSNFPVLIQIDGDTGLQNVAQANGNDIFFTSDTGLTKIPHEIESYSNGSLRAWVRVPTLYDLTDTQIYMYYGNGTASNQEDPTNVWSDGFEAVWHLNEDPSVDTDGSCAGNGNEICDSTANNYDGDMFGTLTSGDSVTGVIGNAIDFTANAFFNTGNGTHQIEGSADRTFCNWAYTQDFNDGGMYNAGVNTDLRDFSLRTQDTTNNWRAQFWGVGNDVDATLNGSLNSWRYYCLTYDGTTARIYYDGILAASGARALNTGDANVLIGVWYRTGDYFGFDGYIDELRISSVERSAEWIETEYNNQVAPLDFINVAATAQSLPKIGIFGGTTITGGTVISTD